MGKENTPAFNLTRVYLSQKERILPILFLLFVVIPIAEIALLIQLGEVIGGLNTLFLVVATAAFGAFFVKKEGLATLQTAQIKMQQNQLPSKEMLTGACLLVAGVLLITPGLMTDFLGFTLVLPVTRNAIVAQLKSRFGTNVMYSQHGSSGHASGFTSGFSSQQNDSNEGNVFEGEYTNQSNEPNKSSENRLNQDK